MNRQPVIDGKSIDQFIPAHLRDMFYRHPMPQYKYAIHDGYAPYSFSTDQLVLYLPLWALKGSSFKSVDAYKNTCTATGDLWTPQGGEFDGAVDMITVPDVPSLSALSTFTVIAWFNQDIEGTEGILSKDFGADPSREWALYLNAGLIFFFLFSAVGTNYIRAMGTNDYSDTNWHFVAATWNGVNAIGNQLLYVDGEAEPLSGNAKLGTGAVAHDGAHAVEVGRVGANDDYCFDGKIGEVSIYNRVLSAPEIAHNYNATKWRYP